MSQAFKTLMNHCEPLWAFMLAFAPSAPFVARGLHGKAATGSSRESSDAMALLSQFLRLEPSAPAPARPPIVVPAAPLVAGVHWTRVSTIVQAASRSTVRMLELQSSARAQVDLAEYALDHLLADIANLVTLPLKTQQRHRPQANAIRWAPALGA